MPYNKTGYQNIFVLPGITAEENQKFGERLAYYQQAVERLTEAKKLAKYIEPTVITHEALIFTNDVVEGKKKAAKNENEFIYHEEVPDKDLLTEMKPVCLVKALPIDFDNPKVCNRETSCITVVKVILAKSVFNNETRPKLGKRN